MCCRGPNTLPCEILDQIWALVDTSTKHKLQQTCRHLRSRWLETPEDAAESLAQQWHSQLARRLWRFEERCFCTYQAVELAHLPPQYGDDQLSPQPRPSDSKVACTITIQLHLLARHVRGLLALAATCSREELHDLAGSIRDTILGAIQREVWQDEWGHLDLPRGAASLIYQLRLCHNACALSDSDRDLMSQLFWRFPYRELSEIYLGGPTNLRLFFGDTWSLEGPDGCVARMLWHTRDFASTPPLVKGLV